MTVPRKGYNDLIAQVVTHGAYMVNNDAYIGPAGCIPPFPHHGAVASLIFEDPDCFQHGPEVWH